MPRSKSKPRPCSLCLGPADGGYRRCLARIRALAVHYAMMLLTQLGADQSPALASDPERIARLARYEDRADRGLPLFG